MYDLSIIVLVIIWGLLNPQEKVLLEENSECDVG